MAHGESHGIVVAPSAEIRDLAPCLLRAAADIRRMGRGKIASVNPATGKVVKEFEAHSESEIERRLQTAADAFREYRRLPIAERARWLMRAAEILEAEKQGNARVMTLEMGKPLRAAIQEVEKSALGCRYLRGERRALPCG